MGCAASKVDSSSSSSTNGLGRPPHAQGMNLADLAHLAILDKRFCAVLLSGDSGNVYEGEYKADKQEGRGTYRYADGSVEVGCCKGDKLVGEGVMWSADKKAAWRLRDGAKDGKISLKEAAAIAARVGEPAPVRCRA